MGCVEKNLLPQGQVPVPAWGMEILERKNEPLAKANRLANGLNTGSRVGMGSAGGLGFGGIGEDRSGLTMVNILQTEKFVMSAK
jgi:hypothetical protein